MSSLSTTHLKLFVLDGEQQVALFSGPDEHQDWQRNVPAEQVIATSWHLLPKETLLELGELTLQGVIAADAPLTNQYSSIRVAWNIRAASFASQLADAAAGQGNRSIEADCCERVAQFLRGAAEITPPGERQQQIIDQRETWLRRAVEARLSAWNAGRDPREAEGIARLFAELTLFRDMADEANQDRAHAAHNHQFWIQQAVSAWINDCDQSESRGNLAQAEEAAAAVLRLLAGVDACQA